jgi:signal transduction histidine kinase/ligand-binding sensor domain-containing protein
MAGLAPEYDKCNSSPVLRNQNLRAIQPWLLLRECDIKDHRDQMGGDRHSRFDDRRRSGCVTSRLARCLTLPFVRDTVRLSILAAGCWLAICKASSPQVRSVRVPTVNGGDIPFTHVSLETPSGRGIVNRIVQDDQGFLWFGANHGLLRYDGYQFRAFVHDPGDPNSITAVNIMALFKDHTGKMWIGSTESLERYDPASGIFELFPIDAGNTCGPTGAVRDITEDRAGMIWLATDNGLRRLDPATSKLNCYQHRQDDDSNIASNFVKAVLESRNGTLWIATTLGLEAFDPRTGRTSRRVTLRGPSGAPLNLDGNKVSLFEDHTGTLWISIPGQQECGLTSFDPHLDLQSAYSFGPGPADTGYSIIEDEDQALWFANWHQGIVRLDRDRERAVLYHNSLDKPNSLSAGGVMTLLHDRDHRIWVGIDPGLVDWFDPRPPSFRTYYHDPGDANSLSDGAVVSVLQDSRGIVWIGNMYGLDRFDRRTGHVTHYSGKRVSGRSIFRIVHAIAEDRAGYLWFGEWGNGLDRLNPRTGEVKSYRHANDDPSSLSHDVVESLFVDHRGTLWVGAYNALNRFDPKTERFQVYTSGVAGLSQYRAITEDSSGALWLGSLGTGLHRFDPERGQFTVYRNEPANPRSLTSDVVNSVYVDLSGAVWAGTNYGLCRLDQANHTFACYSTRDGLSANAIEGILEDERGNLWLSTSDGLSRFDPRLGTVRNYYAADGLPGNEFRFGAASKSSTGEMFFGASSGLLAFFPTRVTDNTTPPPVVLTDFWLFGDRRRVGKEPLKQSISFIPSLTFAPSQNIFSFEFSALSYLDPTRNRYRYRLEPLEKEWNERDSTRRLVTYTTLAPGDYVFRVQGSNSLGVWNTNGASVQIRVLGPWWTWWWVRVAFMLLTLAAIIALYRFRVRRLADQLNLRLEERVNERTRIARDLHDTLLQSFQGLVFRFQAVRNMLPQRPEEAMQALDGALERTDQAIAEGRDAIQGLRASTVVTNELAQAVRALGNELASQDSASNSARFHVVVEGPPRDLHPILRDDVYAIAREAVRNAFRHAQAHNIEADITYSGSSFQLRIRDDGKGIDPGIVAEGRAGHYGVQGMRERAKRIGGRLDVWSGDGAGTEIELSIPGSIAYGTSPGRTVLGLFRKKAANS